MIAGDAVMQGRRVFRKSTVLAMTIIGLACAQPSYAQDRLLGPASSVEALTHSPYLPSPLRPSNSVDVLPTNIAVPPVL